MRIGFVKVINGTKESIHPCTHVQVNRNEDNIQVEVLPGNITLEVPRDGQVIYLMNTHGDTIDSYPWPPKPKKKEFRNG